MELFAWPADDPRDLVVKLVPATYDAALVAAVLDLARQDAQLARSQDADGELLAQVLVAARHESARTLTDVLLRRTGLGTLGHPGDAVLEAVAGVVAPELGWSDARRDAELDEVDRRLTLPW